MVEVAGVVAWSSTATEAGEAGGEAAGALASVDIDASYFAERYEEAILTLNKLTPHQRERLEECLTTEGSFHITAPAGAGKTFVALHRMLEALRAEDGGGTMRLPEPLPLPLP